MKILSAVILFEMIVCSNNHFESYQDIIQEELNVKDVHWVNHLTGLEDVTLKVSQRITI